MSFMSDAEIDKLRQFITAVRAKPDLLWEPKIEFFREYLSAMGAKIPEKPKPQQEEAPKPKPEPAKPKEQEEPMEKEPEEEVPEEEDPESEVELDMEGVIGEALKLRS